MDNTDSDSSFEGFNTDDLDAAEAQANNNLYDFSDIEVSSVLTTYSSDSDTDYDDYDVGYEPHFKPNPPVWTRNFQYVHVPPFTGTTGVTLPPNFDEQSSEIEIFKLFFSQDVIEMITRNTNSYAQFVIEQKKIRNPNYTDKNWTGDITEEDICAYYGLCCFFGLSPSPRYKTYWSSDPFLGNEGVKSTMTKTMYEKITEYLHVSDRRSELQRNDPNYDHLQKVRPLLNHMSKAFPKFMKCSPEQAIDESMISFRGRFFARQFIKNKPHR